MKVAVIGQDINALEMTLRLWSMGASVTWYKNPEIKLQPTNDSNGYTWDELITPTGLQVLTRIEAKVDLLIKPTEKEFQDQYIEPLKGFLNQQGVIKEQKVERVLKRFLIPGEVPTGSSRFADLFRVVSLLDPTASIENDENKDFYQKMGKEVMASLKDHLEIYDDFDVVIDASENNLPTPMGPGGWAIGERKFQSQIHYTHASKLFNPSKGEFLELALIGSGLTAALQLREIYPWLKTHPSHRLFVITTEPHPFLKIKNEYKNSLINDVNNILNEFLNNHKTAMIQYEMALDLWNQEEDYIKAKKPAPALPIPQIVFFSGHMVTGIDKLINQERFFLTCEKAPWRESVLQPENGQLDLKTIGVDQVVVALTPGKATHLFQGLDLLWDSQKKDARSPDGTHPEEGVFSFPRGRWFSFHPEKQLKRQEQIIKKLTMLFSPKSKA